MNPISFALEITIPCFKQREIIASKDRIEDIFHKFLENKLSYADLRQQIRDSLNLLHICSLENKKLVNMTIFTLTSLKSWYLAEKILTNPGSKFISQGNMIQLLWEAMHSECTKIVQIILERHISILRKRDVEAAILFLNPELGFIDKHQFEESVRLKFMKEKLNQKDR